MINLNCYPNFKNNTQKNHFGNAQTARFKMDIIATRLHSPQAHALGAGMTKKEAIKELEEHFHKEDAEGKKLILLFIETIKKNIANSNKK